ncbi:hypothetical protein M3Y97_00794800 [Aphelenchoides bicaudatus]|nr:hypothetical protein M3Y97_00794800 [Aphelenchoides bicaudatus]
MQINESSMTRRYASLCSLISIVFVLYLLLSFVFTSTQYPTHSDSGRSYGIVIDAGSTGSRLFLYSFSGGSETELINVLPVKDENGEDVVKKVTPGLSSFENQPDAAPEHIKPLLNYASKYIPVEQQPYTPVFIFATAGMRLLTKEKQDTITNALRTKLPEFTNLQIMSEHIQVIDGKWEGIYSWIAVNYVLGKFKASAKSTNTQAVRETSAGMIDMGGASVQIAFELPQNTAFNKDALNAVNLGCIDNDNRFSYNLFVTTFLGFGVNEGLKKYEQTLVPKVTVPPNSSSLSVPYVKDNCLPDKFMKVTSAENGTEFLRLGTGNWDSCVSEIVGILKKAGECTSALKCFFDGVEAPPVDLSSIELYGFSEYWYSMHDVLALGGIYHHDIFEKGARKFCTTAWEKIKADKGYPNADVGRLEGQCFKSAWIHAILHDGFHVNELKHKFQTALRIRDQEVQWALGALLYQMRYFPLRDIQKNYIHARHSGSSILYSLLLVVFLIAIFGVVIFVVKIYWNPKTRFSLKKDPGVFGYRMLNQNPNGSSSSFSRLPV